MDINKVKAAFEGDPKEVILTVPTNDLNKFVDLIGQLGVDKKYRVMRHGDGFATVHMSEVTIMDWFVSLKNAFKTDADGELVFEFKAPEKKRFVKGDVKGTVAICNKDFKSSRVIPVTNIRSVITPS